MAKKKNKSQLDDAKPKPKISSNKPKREVQVVTCPSAFPISTKPKKKRQRDDDDENNGKSKKKEKLLDWHQTAKEIRNYGAQAFIGRQKKDYEDEQYYKLTGRHKAKPKCPLPLVRGLKRAAAKRDAKAKEEARKAGIVIPKKKDNSSRKSMSDHDFHKFGPAPNIGFMKDGQYRATANQNNTRANVVKKRR
jgi:hypothetical protein